jgi:leucyl/phenylalanyl-tRNA--protein transferase
MRIPLTPHILENAYRQGVFPMGDPHTGKVEWYRPDPRAVIDLEGFHLSRRLAKTIRSGRFRFSVNRAFRQVMEGCSRSITPDEVWITSEIIDAYCELQARGTAHSVEAWEGEELAGGLYGVSIGGAFMGESMFHVVRDASKACLAVLVQRLCERGFTLLDTQFTTPHLEQFGVLLLPHEEYQRRLDRALMQECQFADVGGEWVG